MARPAGSAWCSARSWGRARARGLVIGRAAPARAPTGSPASGATTRCRGCRADELPGPRCYCGRDGCIERFVSGPALTADHERATGTRLDPAAIVAAAAKGDDACRASLARHEDRLARALAHVVNLVDPDVIVLGGGLSHFAHLYANLPARIAAITYARASPPIVRARHGDASGVRGAAMLWPA